jgi:hypothetical protein
MRSVSERFLETLRGSHRIGSRVRVCSTYQTGTNPTGVEISVVDGNVRSSATAAVRSTLDLLTTELWPEYADDLITPYGNELYVEKFIAYGNGQREFVGLGYFRIDTPEQEDVPEGAIRITAPDRWQGIADAEFLAPRQFPANMSRGDLVSMLITEVYPSAVISWDDAGVRDSNLGRPLIIEQDRAQCLSDLFTAAAKIGYFRYDGVFRIETPPDVTGEPSWTVDAGENGVLVKMSRGLTRTGVKNAFVATGEAADTTPPARGVAYDLDPNSPTYYYGRFGPVPGFFSSPLLTTNTMAAAAAKTQLQKSIGLPYQVSLGSIPNPALEPYDVLTVRYPRTSRNRSLRTETHIVDEITIPLLGDPVQMKTREQRVQLIHSEE